MQNENLIVANISSTIAVLEGVQQNINYAERIFKAVEILQKADRNKAHNAITQAIQVLLGKNTKKFNKEKEIL